MLTYSELVVRLNEVKGLGFVKTHRTGPTGIGKTLEDLLGITENNVPGPDAELIELKSARKGAKSMLTLFTKSPLPEKANSVLLERFGYASSRGNGKKELHTTVRFGVCNTLKGKQGFKIEINDKKVMLVSSKGECLGYWDEDTLKSCFERKLPRLMYVKAESKGSGKNEEFLFDEAWLLSGFNFENFVKLLKECTLFIDVRIGQYPTGKPHDHGTGFRVFPDKLDLCFEKRTRIM
jgi:hypothetical protein